jgi:hypothetical protein
MKKIYHIIALVAIFTAFSFSAKSQIIISAAMINTPSSDSAYEYVQLIATQNIDFAANNYSLVFLNNGAATVSGWVTGAAISYKFNITSGIVNRGDVFYVGGSGKRIDGTGSTDISSLNWIKTINTVTTAGDGFGNASVSGVLGNAGSNADGVGVFSGTAIDSASIPIDAIFYGSSIGSAFSSASSPYKGYKVPTNDHYDHAQGLFGQGTNTYFNFGRNLQDTLLAFTGTFDTIAHAWTTPRSTTYVVLNSASTIPTIDTHITLVGLGVGIKQNELLENINIYPNPSYGNFVISNPSENNITIDVLNILGSSVLKTQSSEKNVHINMENAMRGIYFVQVINNQGRKTVKKLVIK